MISYNEAYERVNRFYHRNKLGDIRVAGDAGAEWIFQAKKDEGLYPVLINKETGEMHPCRTYVRAERELLYSAKVISQ